MAQATPGRSDVGTGQQVVDLRVVRERLEAVREALWNVEHQLRLRRQGQRDPIGECRRIWPDIDDDVMDRPPHAADQLGLFMWRGLPMHAAHRAPLDVDRNAALDEFGIEAVAGKLFAAPGPHELAALIDMRFGFDDPRALECRLTKNHGDASRSPDRSARSAADAGAVAGR